MRWKRGAAILAPRPPSPLWPKSTPLTSIASSSSSSPPPPASAASAKFAELPARKTLFTGTPPSPPLDTSAAFIPTILQPRVVVYDGVCHLCHNGVKWVIKVDKYKKIKFCCLQSKIAEPYLRFCGLDREDVLRRFLFVEGPESFYQASTAALRVASYLPSPYSALSALLIIPSPLSDMVYDYVAKRRYGWFGKEEECIAVQEKEMLDRFIDRDEILARDNEKFF